MIINHDFGASNPKNSLRKHTNSIDAIWPDQSAMTLMIGFDGPTSLFGFSDEPHKAIYMTSQRFKALSAPSFGCLAPRLVLTPLVSAGFDVMDYACELSRLGYQGRYVAVIDRVPNAAMIQAEVLDQFPSLCFWIAELGNCDVVPFKNARASGG